MFLLKCQSQTNFWYLVDKISEYDFILAHIEVSSRSNQIFQCYCRLFKIQSNVWENQFLWFVYLNSEGFYVFVVQSLRALIPLYICCCVERLDCILDYHFIIYGPARIRNWVSYTRIGLNAGNEGRMSWFTREDVDWILFISKVGSSIVYIKYPVSLLPSGLTPTSWARTCVCTFWTGINFIWTARPKCQFNFFAALAFVSRQCVRQQKFCVFSSAPDW